jgi:hypothetical protein
MLAKKNTLLIEQAKNGNLIKVEDLLKDKSINVNAKDQNLGLHTST